MRRVPPGEVDHPCLTLGNSQYIYPLPLWQRDGAHRRWCSGDSRSLIPGRGYVSFHAEVPLDMATCLGHRPSPSLIFSSLIGFALAVADRNKLDLL
ncbi:hypothetical protein BHE74_00045612 [Ensete ventricosum]|nr:hypothetical protein BHE74_00045612 [Ensete ventricosum]